MTPRRPRVLLAALLAGAALARGQTSPGRAGAATWLDNLSATTTATWSDNISRTSNAATRKNAMSYDFSVDASRHQQLAPSWLLTLGAGAEYLAVPDYDRTSSLKFGVRAGLQEKFGLGPLAPVLQFDAGYGYKAARYSGDRGGTAEAGVRLAKRLNPALQVALSGRWLKHDANSLLFDIQQRSHAAEVVWDINDRWRLTGSAGRLEGTIVANAEWNVWGKAIGGVFGPVVSNYYNSTPWTVTGLYGNGWVSYNVEAHVDLWSVALACAVSDQLTMELRTSSAFVVNKIGVRYPQESWGLGVNYRF